MRSLSKNKSSLSERQDFCMERTDHISKWSKLYLLDSHFDGSETLRHLVKLHGHIQKMWQKCLFEKVDGLI